MECFGEPRLEAAADFARPAEVHDAFLGIEGKARLLAFEAVSVGDRVDVEVIEPGAQRLVDLRRADTFAYENAAVHVDFGSHGKLRC
jgi:hypothetical protein